MKIAHIINPVAVPPKSDLYTAQPITFASLERARAFATDAGIEVDLLASCYAEDRDSVPAGFRLTPLLQRSVLDCGAFQHPRKLPLIADILAQGYSESDADYLIYSNVDIGVQPHFYTSVAALIAAGNDALVINRRTIAKHYASPEQLMLIYAEAGKRHPGYDCFVFRRELVPAMQLREVCIGATAIGLVMIANLMKLANGFALHEDLHLSFHIGDDQVWRNNRYDDYRHHNEALAVDILTQLEQDHGPFREQDPGWAYQALQRLRQPPSAEPAPEPAAEPTAMPVPAAQAASRARWTTRGEARRPSTAALVWVNQAGDRIHPDSEAQREWLRHYRHSHRTALAFDLDLVQGCSGADDRGLVYGAVPPLLACALQLAGHPMVAVDPAPGRLSANIDGAPDIQACDPEREPLPLADGQINFIVCNELLSHLAVNPLFTLGEALRVLKPGGRLLLSTANPASTGLFGRLAGQPARPEVYDDYARIGLPGHRVHIRDYSPAQACRLLQRCGFRIDQVVHRGRYPRRALGPLVRLMPGLRPYYSVIATKMGDNAAAQG